MHKFFSGVALSVTIIAGNMAPALANPTNLKTGNGVTVNSVAPNPNLVEIEGRTLTDAEASKVEGEIAPWLVAAGIFGGGAVAGVVTNGVQNHKNGKPVFQNWGSSAVIGGGAATCLAIRWSSPACASVGPAWQYRKW